jgi:hypothetical protein
MARELDFIIFGFPRSGTKALIRELNLHPHVYCAQERFHFGTDHSRLVFPNSFLDPSTARDTEDLGKIDAIARALPARMCAMPATSCHVIISRSTASIARCPTSRTHLDLPQPLRLHSFVGPPRGRTTQGAVAGWANWPVRISRASVLHRELSQSRQGHLRFPLQFGPRKVARHATTGARVPRR